MQSVQTCTHLAEPSRVRGHRRRRATATGCARPQARPRVEYAHKHAADLQLPGEAGVAEGLQGSRVRPALALLLQSLEGGGLQGLPCMLQNAVAEVALMTTHAGRHRQTAITLNSSSRMLLLFQITPTTPPCNDTQ